MIRRPPRSTRTDTLFPYTTLFRAFRRGHAQDGLSARLHHQRCRGREEIWARNGLSRRADPEKAAPGRICHRRHHVARPRAQDRCRYRWTRRSEERRGGNELVSPFRTRVSPYHYKTKKKTN